MGETLYVNDDQHTRLLSPPRRRVRTPIGRRSRVSGTRVALRHTHLARLPLGRVELIVESLWDLLRRSYTFSHLYRRANPFFISHKSVRPR